MFARGKGFPDAASGHAWSPKHALPPPRLLGRLVQGSHRGAEAAQDVLDKSGNGTVVQWDRGTVFQWDRGRKPFLGRTYTFRSGSHCLRLWGPQHVRLCLSIHVTCKPAVSQACGGISICAGEHGRLRAGRQWSGAAATPWPTRRSQRSALAPRKHEGDAVRNGQAQR